MLVWARHRWRQSVSFWRPAANYTYLLSPHWKTFSGGLFVTLFSLLFFRLLPNARHPALFSYPSLAPSRK